MTEKDSAKSPRRLAVTMNKGGSGKTTTAVHLAAALAAAGKTVLLIDSDPQSDDGNVAGHLGLDATFADGKSLYDFIVGGDTEAVGEARENLFVLRGGYPLNDLREHISQKMGREMIYKRMLGKLEDIFEFVIVDTPPSWDVLNLNALFYADEIILPINLEGMTVNNLKSYLETNLRDVQECRRQFGMAPLHLSFALPTRFDRRTKQSEEILNQIKRFFGETLPQNAELQTYGETVLCEPIRYNVRISEAAGHGKTVFEFEPRSPGAADYATFAAAVRR